MKGLGTDEDTLIEIIVSRTPAVLQEIKARYKQMYNKELEAEVKSASSKNVDLLVGETTLSFATTDEMPANIKIGEKVTLGIRPENIELTENGNHKAKIYSTLPSGMETVVKLSLNGVILTAVVFGSIDFEVNEEVSFNFKGEKQIIFAGSKLENIAKGHIK